jgi:hypothetical protein
MNWNIKGVAFRVATYLLEVTFSWTYSSDLEAVSACRMSMDEVSWKGTIWKIEEMRGYY